MLKVASEADIIPSFHFFGVYIALMNLIFVFEIERNTVQRVSDAGSALTMRQKRGVIRCSQGFATYAEFFNLRNGCVSVKPVAVHSYASCANIALV